VLDGWFEVKQKLLINTLNFKIQKKKNLNIMDPLPRRKNRSLDLPYVCSKHPTLIYDKTPKNDSLITES
jgi:hypothetical protein